MLPVLENVIELVPEASKAEVVVPPVRVNRRSVLWAAPVLAYWRVPPPSTRLAATLVDWPRLLALGVPLVARLPVVPVVKMPALIVVAPVYVLAPLRVNMPLPVFVSAPVPLIMPAKAVLVLSPPVVSVALPRVTKLAVALVSEPMVWFTPFRSSVPVPVMLTAVPVGNRFDWVAAEPVPNHL